MDLPTPNRVIYDRAPLVGVHAEVRFPTILLITSAAPSQFQEKIRREYPIYATNEGGTAQFPAEIRALLSSLPNPLTNAIQAGMPAQAHRFESEDKKRRIVLGSESMVFADTAYVTWEKYEEELNAARTAFEEVYEPAFYSRVGLRYQDQFRRSRLGLDNVPWPDLLNTHILSALADKDLADSVLDIRGAFVLGVDKIPGARARVQYALQNIEGEQCFTLDVDVFTGERVKTDDAANAFHEFSGVSRGIFRHVIRDALHDAMGPKPIA